MCTVHLLFVRGQQRPLVIFQGPVQFPHLEKQSTVSISSSRKFGFGSMVVLIVETSIIASYYSSIHVHVQCTLNHLLSTAQSCQFMVSPITIRVYHITLAILVVSSLAGNVFNCDYKIKSTLISYGFNCDLIKSVFHISIQI